MSEVGFIEKSTLEAIGSAVRDKEGTTDLIPVNTLADRIAALPSGVSKLPQVVNKTITEITAEDLAGITKIGEYTFYNCKTLTSVTFPDNITQIDNYAFYYCSKLTNIAIPNKVKTISTAAFKNCYNLTSVTIGNSVESINSYAFEDCSSLASITIPSSVTLLGPNALKIGSSKNKATITLLGTTPPKIYSSAVFDVSRLEKIIVPAGCGEAYKSATNWANFADYIEEDTE